MKEKAIEQGPTSNVKHNVGITVWVDYPTAKWLEIIALFEHDKRGPLCRRILVEKLQVYQRNPAFKRFLKQPQVQRMLEATK